MADAGGAVFDRCHGQGGRDEELEGIQHDCTWWTAQSVFHCKRKRGGESSVQDTSRTPPRSYPAEHGGYKDRKGNHKGNVKNHIINRRDRGMSLKTFRGLLCLYTGRTAYMLSVSICTMRSAVRPSHRSGSAHFFHLPETMSETASPRRPASSPTSTFDPVLTVSMCSV